MADQVIFQKAQTAARIDGQDVTVYYDVYLDPQALAVLARKAARNKLWRAKGGPIRVQVIATSKVTTG